MKVIKEIEMAIQFHGKKWSADGWKRFLKRKESDLIFLIPGNSAEKIYLEKLNDLIL